MSSGIVMCNIIGMTDVGLVRKNNEDLFLIADPETGLILDAQYKRIQGLPFFKLLLVVSDGMGGAEGGEVASALTVEAIRTELAKLPKQLSPQSRLEAAVEEANRTVWTQRDSDPILSRMGATATAMLVERDMAYIAEVGDSRAYILRDGRIKQLTVDQTMLQLLIDSGTMSPEAATAGVNKNVLLQAIGNEELLQTAVTSIQIQVDDIFLLCSDGLSGKMSSKEMKDIIEKHETIEAAAAALIEEAKARGGEDNITVVLAKFEGNALSTKVQTQTLTKQINFLTKFDPSAELEQKPKREVRPATFDYWLHSSIVDAFVRSDEQRQALSVLGDYGDYLVFRQGDVLVSPEEKIKEYYWLISGRYVIMKETPQGENQPVTFIVPPTDQRLDRDIQEGSMMVRVKRQFFTAGMEMLDTKKRDTLIKCADEENVVIRISVELYQRIARILGERFVTATRYS